MQSLTKRPWLLALAAAVFLPALSGAFVFDDTVQLGNHPDLLASNYLHFIYHSDRPVTALTFALNHLLTGLGSPWAYHLPSVVLHGVNVVLVFKIILALAGETVGAPVLAALFALAFGLHPLQSQAVCYVIQRSEPLATCFSLATILLMITEVRTGLKKYRYLWLLTLVLAVTSKSWAIVLPLALVILRSTLAEVPLLAAARANALSFVTMLWPVFLSLWFKPEGMNLSTDFGDRLTYLLKEQGVLLHYLGLIIAPIGLHFDHSEPKWLAESTGFLGFVLVTHVALAIFLLRKTLRGSIVAWALLTADLALAPTSTLVPFYDLLVEHRMYFPFALLCIAGAVKLQDLSEKKLRRATIVLAALLVAFAPLSFMRAVVWGNDLAVMEEGVRLEPDYDRPAATLSVYYLFNRNPQKALELSGRAVQLKTVWRNNLYYASALGRLERRDESVTNYRKALQLNPAIWEMVGDDINRLAHSYAQQGRMADAQWWLERCRELAPGFAGCRR